MAREYAQVRLAIWGDDDFRALSPRAQHLYLMLLTSPSLSHCGVGDWRPKRIAALAAGWSADEVEEAAAELVGKLFIVVDEDTEEVLVRSFLRHDGLMKQPKMATAMASAHAAVASTVLRRVIVHELRRLKDDFPELKGWGSEKASELLSRDAVDPSTYPLGKGSAEEFGNRSEEGSVKGLGKGKSTPSGKGSGEGCPTPAPTPTPSNQHREDSLRSSSPELALGDNDPPKRKKPAKPLPVEWKPTDTHRAYASEHGLDIDREVFKFRNHASANDRRQANWNGAFSNWLAIAQERNQPRHHAALPAHTHLDPGTGRLVER